MYLVYSKLSRDGFKIVRSSHEIYKDTKVNHEDIEEDVDTNMIEPVYGVELMTNPLKAAPDWLQEIRDNLVPHVSGVNEDSEYGKDSWLEDILSDIVDGVVEKAMEEERENRKRKRMDGDDIGDSKQARLELSDFIPICPSPKYEIPDNEEDDDGTLFCLRCLKRHIGGEKSCKSNDEGCFICGEVGHFKVVHEVEDEELRNKISIFLNISHYDLWEKYAPEVVTLEDQEMENQDAENANDKEQNPQVLDQEQDDDVEDDSNQNLYINPFHESDHSSGEEEEQDDIVEPMIDEEEEQQDDIAEPVIDEEEEGKEKDTEAPVIEIDDDCEDDEITTCDIITNNPEVSKSKPTIEDQRSQERELLIYNHQNLNLMIANAIQHQVSAAQAEVDAAAAALPTTLVEGPNNFLCKICNVTCNTPEMLKIHEGGQKHKKKVIRSKGLSQMESKTTNPSFGCDICGIECTDGVALVAHFKGKRHLKSMTNQAQMNSSRYPKSGASSSSSSGQDNDVMIVTEKAPSAQEIVDDNEEDIEILTGDSKTREEILNDFPNCQSSAGALKLNKPRTHLLPSNTWTSSKTSREIDINSLFKITSSECEQDDICDDGGDSELNNQHFFISTNGDRNVQDLIDIEDDDDVILVEDNANVRIRKKITTPLSRPFRGLYPAKEYVRPLASTGGKYDCVRNFGFHSKPPKMNGIKIRTPNVWNKFKSKSKANVGQSTSNKKKPVRTTENVAQNIMGIADEDTNDDSNDNQVSQEQNFEELAARAREWIAKRTTQNDVSDNDFVDHASERLNNGSEILKDLTEKAKEWRKESYKTNDNVDFVDLGSSDEEITDEVEKHEDHSRSESSSSYYSDDISAHSELRYFKYGPLASLWTFEDKIGPLICPEMGGSMREIYNRLRMEPPEPVFKTGEDETRLQATYNLYLSENYKKNSKSAPDYRIIIQKFTASLPSPAALCDLDRTYPDAVPFLFAIVSGGTVSFFNVDRVDLPSFYRNI